MSGRIYHINENIFEDITTEEQAYWLGFFTMDGSITENKIRLTLAIKDKDHVLKWKKFTEWTGKDYYHKDTNAWEVYFRSTKMKSDLAKYGVTPRKTFTLRYNQGAVPPKLKHHYIRGMFDADGSIPRQTRKITKENGKKYEYKCGEFSIGKNREFVKALQKDVFIDILHLPNTSTQYTNKSIGRIRYGGIDQLEIIYKYLYKDATIYIERKEAQFRDILLGRGRLASET